MISFIIIGRNEGWKLTKCMDSVVVIVENNQHLAFEVIYVDSRSSDNSIEVVKKYPLARTLLIKGECSVAIARNIGAKEAHGDILFFLDGDIELSPNFLQSVLNNDNQLKYEYLTGRLINYFYNSSWDLLSKQHPPKVQNDSRALSLGGIYLIKKELWNRANGNRTKYKNAFEDTDLSLRLISTGVKPMLLKETMGIHHTISYRSQERLWKMLFSGQQSFRGVLYRDHFFQRSCLKMALRNDYTVFILITCVVLSFLLNPFIALAYPAALIARILLQKEKKSLKDVFTRMAYFLLRDCLTMISFVGYFPKNKKLLYEEV